jgi:hypothetical protein
MTITELEHTVYNPPFLGVHHYFSGIYRIRNHAVRVYYALMAMTG